MQESCHCRDSPLDELLVLLTAFHSICIGILKSGLRSVFPSQVVFYLQKKNLGPSYGQLVENAGLSPLAKLASR